ncbi:hypothetical protein [Methylobacterium terricola]|uniref:hypothetical protein n=1 Tax=Methylobacterium terricola TaxID=2583531 RepID=UPI0014862F5D|nr:hypothetical protein [Methylobacterium terricola]
MDGTSTIYLVAVAVIAAGGGYGYLRWSSWKFDQKYGRATPSEPHRHAASGE